MSDAKTRARNALLGVFVADAASAGLHWFYDQAVIEAKINTINDGVAEFTDPVAVENPWHKRISKGDFTHYGDHAKVALESLVETKTLDVADVRAKIAAHFGSDKYVRYLDHATKEFLKNGGTAGVADNQDGALAKAAAIAVYAASKSDAEFESLAIDAIKTTNDDPSEESATPYAVAATWIIRKIIKDGATISEAVAALKNYTSNVSTVPNISKKVTTALSSVEANLTLKTAQAYGKEVGLHCTMTSSFAVAVRALLDAESTSFENVVRKEILVGGDTSGRLLFSGAAAGAAFGVPENWIQQVNEKSHIVDLVDKWVEISQL